MRGFIWVTQVWGDCMEYDAYFRARDISGIIEGGRGDSSIIVQGKEFMLKESFEEVINKYEIAIAEDKEDCEEDEDV